MKNIMVIMIIAVMAIGCSKKQDYSVETAVLKNWEYSIKALDFESFKHSEAFIGSYEQFQDMYRDFYFRNSVLLSVGEQKDGKDYDGNPVKLKKIEFGGLVVKRGGETESGTYLGSAEIIRYTSGGSSESGWRISNTTITRNEK